MQAFDLESATPRWRRPPVWIIAVVVMLLDALTKTFAERGLTWAEPVPILGDLLQLTLGYNTGVAFGLFANSGPWTLLSSLLIMGGMLWFIRNTQILRLPGMRWAMGVILGGALGNFVDRLADGRVTDFLDVGLGMLRWPTFNLADSAIMLGVAGMAWLVNSRYSQTPQSYRPTEG